MAPVPFSLVIGVPHTEYPQQVGRRSRTFMERNRDGDCGAIDGDVRLSATISKIACSCRFSSREIRIFRKMAFKSGWEGCMIPSPIGPWAWRFVL